MKNRSILILGIALSMFLVYGCDNTSESELSQLNTNKTKLNDMFDYSSIIPEEYIDITIDYNDTSKFNVSNYSNVTKKNIDDYIGVTLEADAFYKKSNKKKVKKNDIINLNVSITTEDGILINSFENSYLKIGNGNMDAVVEGKLINHIVGDTFEEENTLPDNYDGYYENSDGTPQSLAGAKVFYNITINYICGDRLAFDNLTDNDIPLITNGACTNISEYRNFINKTLIQSNFKDAEMYIWKTLVENCKIKNPAKSKVEAIYEAAYKNNLVYYKEMAANYSVTLDELIKNQGYQNEEFYNEVKQEAIDVVKQNLIAYFIADKENLKISEEEFQTLLQSLATEFEYSSTEELINDYGINTIHAYFQMQAVKKYLYSLYGIDELSEKAKLYQSESSGSD